MPLNPNRRDCSVGSDEHARRDYLKLDAPVKQDGQSMDMSSVCPIDSGVSAVKLRPELLMSIVRPDPLRAGPRWRTTLYRTSRSIGTRTLERLSELSPCSIRTRWAI